jgi:hypothetical protein
MLPAIRPQQNFSMVGVRCVRARGTADAIEWEDFRSTFAEVGRCKPVRRILLQSFGDGVEYCNTKHKGYIVLVLPFPMHLFNPQEDISAKTNRSKMENLAIAHKGLVWSFLLFLVVCSLSALLPQEGWASLIGGFLFLALLCLQSRYLYRASKILGHKWLTLIALTPIIPIVGLVSPIVIAVEAKIDLWKAGIRTGLLGAKGVKVFQDLWRR